MAPPLAVLRLEKKLRTYVDKLEKITEEAAKTLSADVIFDQKPPKATLWILKKSSLLLSECLSRVRELELEIDVRFMKEVDDSEGELFHTMNFADTIRVQAEMMLVEVNGKLSFLNDITSRSRSPSPRKSIAPEHEVEPKSISTEETVSKLEEKSSNLTSPSTENENLLSNSISALRLTENEEVATKEESDSDEETALDTQEEVTGREFNLTRFTGNEEDFKEFWLEFQETVGKSPLEPKQKFAALRCVIRGNPYFLFQDLDYQRDEHYEVAVQRIREKFSDQSNGVKFNKRTRPMPSFGEIPSSYTGSKRWSDEHFARRYCGTVPMYKKPSQDLLVRAMRAFLNLYVVGPRKAEDYHHFFNVWLILLHGVKLQGRYLIDCPTKKTFGQREEIAFPDVAESKRENLFKFAPCYLLKKENDEKKPKFWKWTYSFVEEGVSKEETITSKIVKNWYTECWNLAGSSDAEEFQKCVNYFALLSMILFRASIKEAENIEKYVTCNFHRLYRMFDVWPRSLSLVVPPPHCGVHKLVRKTLFRKFGVNFKVYLTYLVGCYAFSRASDKALVRNFLNTGCLRAFSGAGIGTVYWLRKAADSKGMKPKELLTLFLIDSTMKSQVEYVHHFIETYRTEVTWWWARLFENWRFVEVSTANCPAFAYACFVVQSSNETKTRTSLDFPQFARFLKKEMTDGQSGKNLGIAVRNLVNELKIMPLSRLTKGLHKRTEMDRCAEI